MKIEIQNTDVTERSGIAKSGNPYTIRNQKAWLHTPDKKYPVEITINLHSENVGYAAGEYAIHPSSYYVNRFNQLTIASELKLVPVSVAQKAA